MDRLQQAKEIAAGLTNFTRLKLNLADSDVENIARARMSVCNACPDHDESLGICSICRCILAVKTRSMESSCVSNYWGPAKTPTRE